MSTTAGQKQQIHATRIEICRQETLNRIGDAKITSIVIAKTGDDVKSTFNIVNP